jgi:hypothetical protein
MDPNAQLAAQMKQQTAAAQHHQHHLQQLGGNSTGVNGQQQQQQMQILAPGQHPFQMMPPTLPNAMSAQQLQQPREEQNFGGMPVMQVELQVHEQQQQQQQQQQAQQDTSLAQIAANASAQAAAAAPKPPRKKPVAKDPNAPPKVKAPPKAKAPPKSKLPPKSMPPANPPPGGRALPLRQRAPAEIVAELRGNLDLIRKEYAENMSVAAEQGKPYYLPAWEVTSQFDAAVGIELWLQNHHVNFNAEELDKKTSMLQGIQNKCARGELDNTSLHAVKIDAMACWVDLTKTYYICIRESRNLSRRGVANITPPNFRLPENTHSIPPPRHADDGIPTADLDAAMGEVFGPQAWVSAVEAGLLQQQPQQPMQQVMGAAGGLMVGGGATGPATGVMSMGALPQMMPMPTQPMHMQQMQMQMQMQMQQPSLPGGAHFGGTS